MPLMVSDARPFPTEPRTNVESLDWMSWLACGYTSLGASGPSTRGIGGSAPRTIGVGTTTGAVAGVDLHATRITASACASRHVRCPGKRARIGAEGGAFRMLRAR